MKSINSPTLARLRTICEHRYEPEYARAFADLYWRSLLALACVVTAGTCAYCTSLFLGVLPQSGPETSAAATAIPAGSNFNRAQLDAALSDFAARQAEFKNLQAGAIPPLPDPSQ
jgi:hypothetical protein